MVQFLGSTSDEDKPGLVESAEKGTLFSDEIGDLDLDLQVKLLEFAEKKVFRRVGETKNRTAKVRIIAATNAPLEEKIKAGVFREDLFGRLKEVSITLPPLRERLDDIQPLFEHFARIRAISMQINPLTILPEAIDRLRQETWPNNVRGLLSCAKRAVTIAHTTRNISIDMTVIEEALQEENAAESTGATTPNERGRGRELISSASLIDLAKMDAPPFNESAAAIKAEWNPDGNAEHWKTIPVMARKAIRQIVAKLVKGDDNVLKRLAKQCDITFQIFKKHATGDEI